MINVGRHDARTAPGRIDRAPAASLAAWAAHKLDAHRFAHSEPTITRKSLVPIV
jgi:hypothetical protein